MSSLLLLVFPQVLIITIIVVGPNHIEIIPEKIWDQPASDAYIKSKLRLADTSHAEENISNHLLTSSYAYSWATECKCIIWVQVKAGNLPQRQLIYLGRKERVVCMDAGRT